MIAGALLLLFGGRKIPELMRGLGRGVKEFKDAQHGVAKEADETAKPLEPKKEKEQKEAEEPVREHRD